MFLTKKIFSVINAIVEHIALAGELLVIGRIIETNKSSLDNDK
ncbi:MAG: hypothetical protein BWY69_01439 [Planctomycetes bacterium ADurb.Bin401]|jgi:hypothetical protein|nr:MAG: hypothetical protein BWY69_01439 [Planctomycetes bacterium ADurb.Bin401]